MLTKFRFGVKIDQDKINLKEPKAAKDLFETLGNSRADFNIFGGTTGITPELNEEVLTLAAETSMSQKIRFLEPSHPNQVPPKSVAKWLEENLINALFVPWVLNTADTRFTYGFFEKWLREWEEEEIPFPASKVYRVGYLILNPDSSVALYTGADASLGVKDYQAPEKFEEYLEAVGRYCEIGARHMNAVYIEGSGKLLDPRIVTYGRKRVPKDVALFYGGGIVTPEDGAKMYEAGKYEDAYTCLIAGDIAHKDPEMCNKIAEVIKSMGI
jgi:heptaprenylglyceryl phosphate synthase